MAAKLILTRKDRFLGSNRRYRYKVMIDGLEAGQIKHDGSEEFALTAGVHTLQCKINWMSSEVKTIDVAEGQNIYLTVSSGMKFLLPLYIMLVVGAFLPFYFRQVLKTQIPDSIKPLQFVLVLPCLIYLLLYMSVLRKKYLVIAEDQSNPFK